MKKFILFVIAVIVLISIISVRSQYCNDCRMKEKSIRYMKTVDDLNYIMNERLNCPYCSWTRSIKYF